MLKQDRAFKVNDRVEFTFVNRTVRGRVIEDRGNIGVAGERLYRVVGTEHGVTRTIELPADRLKLLEGAMA